MGSHKVTVSRHGFEKKLHSDKNFGTFEYEGVSITGQKMKVTIDGDKVRVNGVAGMIKPGDSVLIGDDGVAVNSLDYGESKNTYSQCQWNRNSYPELSRTAFCLCRACV